MQEAVFYSAQVSGAFAVLPLYPTDERDRSIPTDAKAGQEFEKAVGQGEPEQAELATPLVPLFGSEPTAERARLGSDSIGQELAASDLPSIPEQRPSILLPTESVDQVENSASSTEGADDDPRPLVGEVLGRVELVDVHRPMTAADKASQTPNAVINDFVDQVAHHPQALHPNFRALAEVGRIEDQSNRAAQTKDRSVTVPIEGVNSFKAIGERLSNPTLNMASRLLVAAPSQGLEGEVGLPITDELMLPSVARPEPQPGAALVGPTVRVVPPGDVEFGLTMAGTTGEKMDAKVAIQRAKPFDVQPVAPPEIMAKGRGRGDHSATDAYPVLPERSVENLGTRPSRTEVPLSAIIGDPPATHLVTRTTTALGQEVDLPVSATRSEGLLRQVSDLILVSASSDRPESVEVQLSPAELGKLKIEFKIGAEGLSIHLDVERADTLDLVRRHLDQLSADLRQSGFGQATFSFGSWSHKGSSEKLRPSTQHTIQDHTLQEETTSIGSFVVTGRMHIRL